MFVTSLEEHPEIVAGDGSLLCEILKPARDELAVPCSLAYARVPPGESTLPHRLRKMPTSTSSCAGRGECTMYIGDEEAEVHAGQHIENTGHEDLTFLRIVGPAWRPEDEEVQTPWGHRNGGEGCERWG